MGPAVVGSGQRYRHADLLSEDLLGTLWRGTDGWSGAPVVVRLLDPRLTSEPGRLHRVATQLRAAQLRVSNPHVARVLDFDLHRQPKRAASVVFEGPVGETLAGRLGTGAALPAELALRLIAAVASGLAAAHAAWIYHSALTAASVLVDGDAVRVIDFGLGELVEGRDDRRHSGPAPSLRDRGPADVLAVGLLFEQLLLGRPDRPTPRENDLRRGWEGRVPRDVGNCLRRALSPHRSQRPDMAELAAALAPSLAATPAREPDLLLPPWPANLEPLAPAPIGPILPPPPEETVPAERSAPAPPTRPPRDRTSGARAPRRRVRRGGVVLGVVAASVVLLGGAGVTGFLALRGPDEVVGRATGAVTPSVAPSTGAVTPSVTPSTDSLERATVPAVLGRRLGRAIRLIQRAGLVAGGITAVPGRAGIVVMTDPIPGEAVIGGTAVDLYVGNGAEA